MNKWQPIETAPKDGSQILIWAPTWRGGGKHFIADWDDNRYAKKPRPYWSYCNERIYGNMQVRSNQPSHWMPLPEGPELDASARKIADQETPCE